LNDTTTKEDGKLAQALEWLNAPREELPQEYHDAFAVWCEVDAIDRQAKELETTQPVGVTEILARRAALKELHTERARLLAVLDGQEQPAQGPEPAPTKLGVNVNMVSTTVNRLSPAEPAPVAPPLNEAPTPDEPAPVLPAKETPTERRARWLAMLEEEEKRAKRGALQRAADREGVDRSNMKKGIDKARAARDAQKRAGSWTSQLVQDGKRAH
jgi:hypothetical protein